MRCGVWRDGGLVQPEQTTKFSLERVLAVLKRFFHVLQARDERRGAHRLCVSVAQEIIPTLTSPVVCKLLPLPARRRLGPWIRRTTGGTFLFTMR